MPRTSRRVQCYLFPRRRSAHPTGNRRNSAYLEDTLRGRERRLWDRGSFSNERPAVPFLTMRNRSSSSAARAASARLPISCAYGSNPHGRASTRSSSQRTRPTPSRTCLTSSLATSRLPSKVSTALTRWRSTPKPRLSATSTASATTSPSRCRQRFQRNQPAAREGPPTPRPTSRRCSTASST